MPVMERISTLVQSQPARFFAVALVASFVTLQVHTLYTDIRSKSKKDRLNRELQELYREDNLLASRRDLGAMNENGGMPSLASAIGNGAVIASTLPLGVAGFDEGLIREQLARNYAFFGEEGMAKIRASTVVIVGCGGVGSWAAMMLART
jgi:tRNA threonylcarbamoyladenosine dehydratase